MAHIVHYKVCFIYLLNDVADRSPFLYRSNQKCGLDRCSSHDFGL